MTAPAIELDDVWFGYGGAAPVVEAVSFAVAPGQFAALIGPNGAGKTTLLHLLLGLRRPDRGRILVFGRPARDEALGYIPQRVTVPRGFPLTVGELVLMGRYGRIGLGRRPRRADRHAAARALERVGLAGLADRPFGALSGGQQQRALIARALAGEPGSSCSTRRPPASTRRRGARSTTCAASSSARPG